MIGVMSDFLEFGIEPLNGVGPIDGFGDRGKAEVHERFEEFFQSRFPNGVELKRRHISGLGFPESAIICERLTMGEWRPPPLWEKEESDLREFRARTPPN